MLSYEEALEFSTELVRAMEEALFPGAASREASDIESLFFYMFLGARLELAQEISHKQPEYQNLVTRIKKTDSRGFNIKTPSGLAAVQRNPLKLSLNLGTEGGIAYKSFDGSSIGDVDCCILLSAYSAWLAKTRKDGKELDFSKKLIDVVFKEADESIFEANDPVNMSKASLLFAALWFSDYNSFRHDVIMGRIGLSPRS